MVILRPFCDVINRNWEYYQEASPISAFRTIMLLCIIFIFDRASGSIYIKLI